MSRMRKVIAGNMTKALQTSAQLTSVVEADAPAIMRLRAQAKDTLAAREGLKLSPLPFFVRAAAETLKAHPVINASIDPDEGRLGFAMDPRPLSRPVSSPVASCWTWPPTARSRAATRSPPAT
ncbi:2-oxo acid dehydrogenase subunit E2 [Actinomadura opuntiae]|uniref:2-oxo acid dehydrogenase subunit E2 n=1 Tax=Actinomadura sp. OS1-43 TaxID=604315 RepID=UPI00255AD8DB|nr:2-oxo acid dehydrogenase subunit E2 [Actinomadura sp. OS1-43]MDL4818602.1 2-oxo acid dehydrogenase subunit E2 [Actinomadura sp. OS1-43]